MSLTLVALMVMCLIGAIYGAINADFYWPEAVGYIAAVLAAGLLTLLLPPVGSTYGVIVLAFVGIILLFRLDLIHATAR